MAATKLDAPRFARSDDDLERRRDCSRAGGQLLLSIPQANGDCAGLWRMQREREADLLWVAAEIAHREFAVGCRPTKRSTTPALLAIGESRSPDDARKFEDAPPLGVHVVGPERRHERARERAQIENRVAPLLVLEQQRGAFSAGKPAPLLTCRHAPMDDKGSSRCGASICLIVRPYTSASAGDL